MSEAISNTATVANASVPSSGNFRLMALGQVVTMFGSSLLRFALSLYILDITGRADLFATLFAISSVPILLAPIGGTISDRFSRKRLMVLYDFICCAVTLAFLFIMIGGNASVFTVGAVMVILGVIGAMETPNGTACIPQLVAKETLESANGIIQAVQSLSGILAPVVGGILYGAVGIRTLVAVSCAAFALAAITEIFIKIPYVKRAREDSMLRTLVVDLKSGFTYVWKEALIRKLMLFAALLNLVLTPCFLVISPLILRITMHSGDALYGAGMGIIEAAIILGALTMGVFSKNMRVNTMYRWILLIAILFVGVALSVTPMLLGTGYWAPFILFMLCMIPMASATTILSIFAIVQVQKKTPAENLGKVMAIIQMVAQCAAPIGQLAYGFLFEASRGTVYFPIMGVFGVMLLITVLSGRMFKNDEG
jgi:MFS family permease